MFSNNYILSIFRKNKNHIFVTKNLDSESRVECMISRLLESNIESAENLYLEQALLNFFLSSFLPDSSQCL